MAIQLPNPGLGDGQTGDNEFVMWTKVKDNFGNTAHAASRSVGIQSGNVLEVGSFGIGNRDGFSGVQSIDFGSSSAPNQIFTLNVNQAPPIWNANDRIGGILMQRDNRPIALTFGNSAELYISHLAYGTEWTARHKFYHTGNTTKDVATGFLKASSPVLHVYNDKITKIHEAEQLAITVDKKGVGHYEIHGTTGLRKNDGWFMSPPRDMHSNVLCMVDYAEKDGVIILKTYKKKFDFETVSIVHDYDNPMDIPEGACVEFRFNDLPEEQLDEPIE